jgi:hypothetical protein
LLPPVFLDYRLDAVPRDDHPHPQGGYHLPRLPYAAGLTGGLIGNSDLEGKPMVGSGGTNASRAIPRSIAQRVRRDNQKGHAISYRCRSRRVGEACSRLFFNMKDRGHGAHAARGL